MHLRLILTLRASNRAAFLPVLLLSALGGGIVIAAEPTPHEPPAAFRKYCFGCHGKTAMGGISLEKLTAQTSVADTFQQWEKVAAALEENRMPPAKMPQPSAEDRRIAASWVRNRLNAYAQRHAGDPGRVTVRRLTSAEYAYAIEDLTGLDLKLDAEFAGDSVGGEGFTNFGDVQFVEEASLERYLVNAKAVAARAVIGAGPLSFYDDPGRSGQEVAAVARIQEIYRANGFRAVAGEGGRPYGLERYGAAFYAAWRYKHREALGEPDVTLDTLAAREHITPRFAQHIWSVLHEQDLRYPATEVIALWSKLPYPSGPNPENTAAAARTGVAEMQRFLIDWPRWLFAAGAMAAGGQGDERALLLTEESLRVNSTQPFKTNLRVRGKNSARAVFSVISANPASTDKPVIVWSNAMIRVRRSDRSLGDPQPLESLLPDETKQKLAFGHHPEGGSVGPREFAQAAGSTLAFDIPTGPSVAAVELQIQARVDSGKSGDAVLRIALSDREQANTGVPVSAIMGNSDNAGYLAWKAGVLGFAARFPQNSQGEPTPSDKDPIPVPFNNVYNQPERDLFHAKLKYYRTDQFLVEKILDDATRVRLDQAWADLLDSFEYHDIFLDFVASKYKLTLPVKSIARLTKAQVSAFPEEPRRVIQSLRTSYDTVQRMQAAAQPGHLGDCLRLAERAWRRPLSPMEKESFRTFYRRSLRMPDADHAKAIRAVLTRALVAPAFLYRIEQPTQSSGVRALSNWELASRLSFFLWSSIPDDELRRAAATGELATSTGLERQVRRMLSDSKARRLSAEFFGQWLGFYRFDHYRGVDTTRYPEFTDEVKNGMYNEAVTFFEYIVRNDRPVREVLTADYTFLTKPLAKHYGIAKEIKEPTEPERVEGAGQFQRGGLLRLGAVLTATSAPLRTSPVKRGDWLLRRILGTPTPPPPADAGSLPADDKSFGGLSVRERLSAHQRNPTCAGCHSRIDPLGFPLERYDAIGRVRAQYADGKPIEDTASLADNTPIQGVEGLLAYLQKQEAQVLRTLSRKLLGYSLGRTVLPSDQPLIDRLVQSGGEMGFAQLTAQIVTSRQFRYRRGDRDDAAPSHAPAGSPDSSAAARSTSLSSELPREGGQ